MINTVAKSNLGKKGFASSYTSRHSSSLREARAGRQGRSPEVGTEAETMEQCSNWLASLRLLSYLFDIA